MMEQEDLDRVVNKTAARRGLKARMQEILAETMPAGANAAHAAGMDAASATSDEPKSKPASVHAGHRQRMRERFRKDGLDGFAPHEVLELLLFYSRARGDTNLLAHALLDAFGSLKGVLEARPEQLMTVEGMGEESATLISLMLPVFRRYSACVCEERRTINNRVEAEQYCAALLAGHRTEHFYVICLSSDNHLLGRRLIAEGTLTEVAAYPRLVVENALNLNAHSVVLCHNHPSGLCVPSPDDVSSTRRLATLLAGLGITVLDHIIAAGDQTYSMAQHGDLPLSLRVEGGAPSLIPADGKPVIAGKKRSKGNDK